ncbi:MAG: DUF1800 domain-containing protein [Candidatus Kapaibacterium sp.]
MNRREFLLRSPKLTPKNQAESIQAAGLEPYTGEWTYKQASHLLRRTMFGATKQDTETILALTMSQAVDKLLTAGTDPDEPKAYVASGSVAQGNSWAAAAYDGNLENQRLTFVQSWWIDLMGRQSLSLREKMVLFWHNHFSCGANSVKDARYMYKQNALLRTNVFGNFKTLARLITLDPAMLRYLSGTFNTKASPNENYARELQELFTIGKGPEIAPGNYTHYTEADIKAAAKILTGWSDDQSKIASKFTDNNHDTSDKTFTAAYGNRVIKGGKGQAEATRELDELLTMIFDQNQTSVYLIRKIYRWFVDYVIDDTVEQTIIQPLAAIFKSNNYEIKPVLDTLFKSAHFYDNAKIGCMIKSPADLVIGTIRQFPHPMLFPTTLPQINWAYRTLRRIMGTMQLDIMNLPNVAGLPAYWQEPVFHEIWINADTLQKRIKFTNDYSFDKLRLDEMDYGTAPRIDPLEVIKMVSDPTNVTTIINDFAKYMFAVQLTPEQITELKNVIIPGLPDYEWTAEWSDYKANPTDEAKQAAVADKLRLLLKYMFAMAEYQLA